MGYVSAKSMQEYANGTIAMRWHLYYNHYPPLPLALTEVCQDAVACYNDLYPDFEDDDFERTFPLPEGITFRGKGSIMLGEVIETCHLQAFLIDG